MLKLPFDILTKKYTKPKFFLCETNKERICQLEVYNSSGVFKFNSMSELSFDVARSYNDITTGKSRTNPFYDKIEALRLIELDGFGYFELQGPELTSDGIHEAKSCMAYSLEYTLSQKYLENFYVNTGGADSVEVIYSDKHKTDLLPVTLYNQTTPELSLLHLILEKIYGWKIGHVDKSLQTLSRQFEIDRESVYDFLMNEVCEKFNCYIVFDTINNLINIYAESLTAKFIGDGKTNIFTISPPFAQINTVSVDGYKTTKWEYNSVNGVLKLEDIPEFGARIEVVDGALTEWETDVFITFDNLSQEININYDADAIKTVLTVTYGDDYDIRETNLGLPYLTDISYYYTVDWMGRDLYDAYTKYMQKSNNLQSEYTNNSQEILKWNDRIAYEENRLSLEYSLVESVSSSTVGTYYIRHENLDGSYYYSEVSLPSEYMADVDYYSNVTTNVNEEKVSNLYTVLKSYFYAYFNNSTEDIEKSLNNLKTLLGFDFMKNYTLSYLYNSLKSAKSTSEMDSAIYNFLNELWVELGRTPLRVLYLNTYRTIQETNIEAGWSNKNNSNYGNYYPVTLFIASIESAIAQRDKVINGYKNEQSVFQKANANISNSLLMYNNFTEEQLIRLNAFLREDELHLDDIIETSLDDLSSSFKIKQDAMESGRIELQKLCQPQLQFSMTMANIYALPEFAPIIHQFQLGKVIRVGLRPDYIKQSRLLEVNINFDDFSDFSCEFGELTSLRSQSDIHADLLSKAISAGKSVATNSSYWTRGSDKATATDLKIQQGLLDATTQIKAIDGTQGIIIDRYGIKLQKVNPTTGEVDPHQTWMTNNMILMSDDGFKTSRSALGQITVGGESYYGLIAEMVLSGYIEGSKIVGGEICSSNYNSEEKNGTYMNLITGDFSLASGKIVYDENKNSLKLSGVTIAWDSTNAPETSDIDGLDAYLSQLDGRIQTYSQTDDPSASWTSTEKNEKIGDLWFNPNDGLTKRWTGSTWETITDSELAELAQTKAQIFTSTPTTPYYKDDLWVQGSSGDIMHCVQTRETGSYVATDWAKSSKYTDDTSLNTFINGDYADDLVSINNQIDKKSETWYQSSDPSSAWVTNELKAAHVGDLWFNTGKNKSYMYDSSYKWVEVDGVPDEVYDAIDGKSTIYVSKPNSQEQGDLLIPHSTFSSTYGSTTYTFIEKKIYRCTTTSNTFRPDYWAEVAYTDDTLAREALEKAKQGVDDASKAFKLATDANTAASNAHSRAESAETNAKSYADSKDSSLSSTLTNAYKSYTNSEVSKLDTAVGNYLGLGGSTLVGSNYVVSPYIGGGYLNITNTNNNSRVIIDPNNKTGNGYIFQVHNGKEVSVGIKADGTASFAGAITAKSLTLESSVKIGTSNISGLSSVATSGSYSDLKNKPTIPSSVADLGFDTSKLIYKGDITQATKTDSNGISYVETTVPSSSGTIKYSTYNAGDYIVFGRSKGANADGQNYICISTDGLLTARNALIYGTVYATDGKFVGDIEARSLKLGSNIKIGTSNISGLSSVATSGSYSDLKNKPTIPSSVADLGFDTSKLIYKGDITQSVEKDDKGNEYIKTVVPSSNGNITYYTHNVGDYILFGRGQGTNAAGQKYFCVSTDGLLTARNALIYGTVYAGAGEIGGFTLSDNILSTSVNNVYVSPGYEEYAKIQKHISGSATLTGGALIASDITGDSNVNGSDLLALRQIIVGNKNYSDYAGAKTSNVKVSIDPTNPEKLINFTATNPWGTNINSYFGINKLRVPTVSTNNILLRGAFVESKHMLYSNTIGTSGTVTLNMPVDSAIGFTWLYIVYGFSQNSSIDGSLIVYQPSLNKNFRLYYNNTNFNEYIISGNTISINGTANNIFIKHVVGFESGIEGAN